MGSTAAFKDSDDINGTHFLSVSIAPSSLVAKWLPVGLGPHPILSANQTEDANLFSNNSNKNIISLALIVLALGHVSISQPITMAWGMQWSDWPDQGHVLTPGAEGQGGSILRKVKVHLSAEGWWVLARQNQWMFTADYKCLESRDLLLYIFLSARQPGTIVGEQYWLSYWRLCHMPYETF